MRFFDFFAGIGGFRLGMEMAGHTCVGHCEIDKYANESYKAMHHPKESEVFFEDVRTIKPADMPECECYCFGFPCQAFSISGQRRGFDDMRGTLIFEILRLAKEQHTQILFGENVSGLLTHDGGWTFKTIISAMGELGYFVEWQILNSRLFGVPHNRERVFIIGHHGGEPIKKIFPITTADQSTGVSIKRYAHRDGFRRCYQTYFQDSSCETIDTMTGGGRQPCVVLDDGRIRKLTPRECFRLQGFPDEYFDRAASVNSDSQLYKQAGNSVTVNVIYEIAKRLKMEDE